jgi:mannose-6-phosphate isomerase-like protein (cupin superfamily)
MNHQVLQAGEGRSFPFAGGTLTIKEDGTRTRGELTVVEIQLPAGAAPPPQHLHHQHEETWYVLDGELEFTVDDEIVSVGPGGWVLVPIGVPHTFANPGTRPARFLSTMTPGFYLNYFEELAARIGQMHANGEPPTRETLGRLGAELMPTYHTELRRPA